MDEGLEIDENVLEFWKRIYKEDLILDLRRCGLLVLCFLILVYYLIILGNWEVGVKLKKVRVFLGIIWDNVKCSCYWYLFIDVIVFK